MKMTSPSAARTVQRDTYFTILHTALSVKEFRFTREAVLAWLAAYPGDLQAGLIYAQAQLGDQRPRQAIPILEQITAADPEYLEAQELLFQAYQSAGKPSTPESLSCLLALGSPLAERETVATWGRQLWMAREAVTKGELEDANKRIQVALGTNPATPLVGLTHLQVLANVGTAPLAGKRDLANYYAQRWPDCLGISLLLADLLMESEAGTAVALLHKAAARDVVGQVARRLWGEKHPYRSLWPDRLELPFETAIPAAVAAALGLNQLSAGTAPETQGAIIETEPAQKTTSWFRKSNPKIEKSHAEQSSGGQVAHTPGEKPETLGEHQQVDIPRNGEEPLLKDPLIPETLLPVQEELSRVAKKLKKSGVMRTDGRFPIYVLFSVRRCLQSYYGPEGTAQIENELKRLAEIIQTNLNGGQRWGARIFFADDPGNLSTLGIKPARPDEPWDLKLALADLDQALASRGEMIGAVLIVGGPEVVPFHNLPNPVEDQDASIPSDSPYATRDENYFVPEWPVGRLPGSSAKDASGLIASLQKIGADHARPEHPTPWYYQLIQLIANMINARGKSNGSNGARFSFGYSAAIWKRASFQVFQPIGGQGDMLISPPNNSETGTLRLPMARLGYFNLHGMPDSPDWYGQRDPSDGSTGPEYPVALRPRDIDMSGTMNGNTVPAAIFTEACYGANISDKSAQNAIALKFLETGSQIFIGSTCMAYGSLNTPLSAADLLAEDFWNNLQAGMPAGEAFRAAKINLAKAMHGRQGYLDGEDQKTLISFILLGDPLARPLKVNRTSKGVARSLIPAPELNTISDRLEPQERASTEMMNYVKHVVEQYLPGMRDAQVDFRRESVPVESGRSGPTAKGRQAARERKLVILSKSVTHTDHVHKHYARITLDEQGKLVKLVVSR